MREPKITLHLFTAILAVVALLVVAAIPRLHAGQRREQLATMQHATPLTTGPLKVHPSNSRYFTDGNGKAIYLTGSHHWCNLQDGAEVGHPPRIFDYDGYLKLLKRHNHNFMRLWMSEGGGEDSYSEPLPYARTGPGVALDGKPKFNLEQFNEAYFARLRSRVIAARDQGVYAAIMLFNGWSIYNHNGHGNPWPRHPFNKANNINDVDGDRDGDGEGKELHTLHMAGINALQRAYVGKVIDAVNDLDNVLYEITNETAMFSKEWQYDMIRFIKSYEASKPKQHPVGMTYFDSGREGAMDALWASPADWISPGNDGKGFDYANSPPEATGKKVVLADTDHIFGVGGDHNWVWKTFTRGLHPIYMDTLNLENGSRFDGLSDEDTRERVRKAMGDTLTYARRMNLVAIAPRSDLCSSSYCLANAGVEYLIYLPYGSHWLEAWIESIPYRRPYRRLKVWIKSMDWLRRTVSVDLSSASSVLSVEWFNPVTSETVAAGTTMGGGIQEFEAPFRGDAVLYLLAK
jgi:hypothetical protein